MECRGALHGWFRHIRCDSRIPTTPDSQRELSDFSGYGFPPCPKHPQTKLTVTVASDRPG